MIRYELKKIFGSVGGKIALGLYIATVILSCFLAANGFMNVDVKWVNEQGESERGLGAVQKLREARNEWEGYLDQEMLTKVIQENSRINATPEGQSSNVQKSNIAYGWKQSFSPIREMINRSYSVGFRTYDYYRADGISVIKEETFYGNRTRQLKDWLYDKTDVALEELGECITDGNTPEKTYEQKELAVFFNRFLQTLSETERRVFLCRYWYLEPTASIAKCCGFSETKVRSMLHRIRKRLRTAMEKEGLQ